MLFPRASPPSCAVPSRRPGLPPDELEHLVLTTFKDFDSIGHNDLCIDLMPPPVFEHDDDGDLDGHAASSRARPPGRLAASLLRKVKSHASSLLSSASSRPAPSRPQQPRRRPRTKSLPRHAALRPSPSPSPGPAPAPPVPALPRLHSPHSIDLGRPQTPVAAAAHVSASTPPSPSSSARLRTRPRLSFLFQASPLRSHSRADRREHDGSDPPSVRRPSRPPFCRSRSPLRQPLPRPRLVIPSRSASDPSSSPVHTLSIYSPHPDSVWTPALTDASPQQTSPPSTLSSASQSCSPLTPVADPLFHGEDDPFRKQDVIPVPPSPPRRPRVPKSKSTPKLARLFVAPSPPPFLRPVPSLGSASATTLPYDLNASQSSLPSASPDVCLPFPLPPDSAQDAITVRVATPTFPPARPPPSRPLPRIPEATPHVTVTPHTAPASQTSFIIPPLPDVTEEARGRSSRTRVLSPDAVAALRALPSPPSPKSVDANHARPPREVFLLAAPAARKRPRSPFPLLEPKEIKPRSLTDRDLRDAVDAILQEGGVPLANPWTSPHSSPRLDDGVYPDSPDIDSFSTKDRPGKKGSVASTATTASYQSALSTITAATTVSPNASPDMRPSVLCDLPTDEASGPPPRTPLRASLGRRSPLHDREEPLLGASSSLLDLPRSSFDSRAGLPRSSFGSDARPDSFYTSSSHSGHLPPVRRKSQNSSARSSTGHSGAVEISRQASVDISHQPSLDVPRPTPYSYSRSHTPALSVVSELAATGGHEFTLPPRSGTSLDHERRTTRTLSPTPSTPSPLRGKRRSFLPLPAIPRIAPLDFGVLGHLSGHHGQQNASPGRRRGFGSGWFD
ncbi:hypothetical protein K488DRAFT_69200 [Vararia minispora EC-137]|uniref:Uncharacterized protein n=1 Tax=Vararia minispora EC-137 TaxID=1314806 RepID=A0ACB8QR64_9AGAM|nr:hypothetical protein K488DRAFT_69200 [Vararia minispora EC-137]